MVANRRRPPGSERDLLDIENGRALAGIAEGVRAAHDLLLRSSIAQAPELVPANAPQIRLRRGNVL
jgi:hypothetical protein